MIASLIILIVSLSAIVISANLFCNALEHLGARLGISEGVTGSIFAAVATALPETIMPILALTGANGKHIVHADIGIGAILGAPFMLSTLSLFVMALAISIKRSLTGTLHPEYSGLKRDLRFFLFGYTLSTIAMLNHYLQPEFTKFANYIIATILLVSYLRYLILTLQDSKHKVKEGHITMATNPLFITRFKLASNYYTVLAQLSIALIILIYFAETFIQAVNNLATLYHISAFLIALIIIPIATELPEKINSITWLFKGKDTLALANITGAMVFQGTLLPILGILFTNWGADSKLHLISIATAILASLWLYFNLKQSQLKIWCFGLNGVLYLIGILASLFIVYR
jgi:cation:H+ antiporter